MREKLISMLEDNKNNITEEVIQEALNSEDPKTFFQDLLDYGCASGMVWKLIYYRDTHDFYDKHYTEIEDIRLELQDESIIDKLPDMDLKNYFAWLSFEHIAYKIYTKLEEE